MSTSYKPGPLYIRPAGVQIADAIERMELRQVTEPDCGSCELGLWCITGAPLIMEICEDCGQPWVIRPIQPEELFHVIHKDPARNLGVNVHVDHIKHGIYTRWEHARRERGISPDEIQGCIQPYIRVRNGDIDVDQVVCPLCVEKRMQESYNFERRP